MGQQNTFALTNMLSMGLAGLLIIRHILIHSLRPSNYLRDILF
jgi:hypothetical protein